MYTIERNEAFKSLEIAFDGKPSEAVRDALKSLHYRWHGVKKIWYGYSDEETVRNAIDNAETAPKTAKTTKAIKTAKVAPKNEFGVEVGDVFSMSWGYDETHEDFFQVAELRGKSSVIVRHVMPERIRTEANSPMSADYVVNITKEQMKLDPCKVFIKNDSGDLKRVQRGIYGETPYIRIGDHLATKIPFGEYRYFESWWR